MTETKQISKMTPNEIKDEVKKAYARVAQPTTSCCGGSSSRTCSNLEAMGYSVEGLPESVTESFAGCGNPVALASLREGEIVLDLGSGAGLDAFLAAQKIGEEGYVIGVDMTQEMIEKAKNNAAKLGVTNVEFRLGDIENLPVENDSIDVIISNCVINLAPNKARVFSEAFRVLAPGGRILISDIVLEKPLPETIRDEVITYTGCLGGAIPEEAYLQLIREAGFEQVKVIEKSQFNLAASAKIEAYKPSNAEMTSSVH